jgi:hypothetical protein
MELLSPLSTVLLAMCATGLSAIKGILISSCDGEHAVARFTG